MISERETAGRNYTVRHLPDAVFDDRWDSLFLPDGVKDELVNYVDLFSEFARDGISPHRLALRRGILFYGPPGCGKSEVARCAPNIWARRRSSSALLLTINAHGLPSGERGGTQKNVASLFKQLAEVAARGLPTFVVIDEVETVGTNRAGVNHETNPLDTLYGVNAFIEHLDDCVQVHANVLFLFTTNLPRELDSAVYDRVDVQIPIPLPDERNRRLILQDALAEIQKVRPLAPARESEWSRLVTLTNGFTARQLRHLPVRALSIAGPGRLLELGHVVRAAEKDLANQQDLTKTGGVYVHEYQRRAFG